jgi:hypothetical protein
VTSRYKSGISALIGRWGEVLKTTTGSRVREPVLASTLVRALTEGISCHRSFDCRAEQMRLSTTVVFGSIAGRPANARA